MAALSQAARMRSMLLRRLLGRLVYGDMSWGVHRWREESMRRSVLSSRYDAVLRRWRNMAVGRAFREW